MNTDEDSWLLIWGSIGVILVIAALIFVLVYRHDATGMVVSTLWERKIDIQTYTTVQESDWDIPPGGRYVREYSAYHHTERVYTGSHRSCLQAGSGKLKSETCTSRAIYKDVPVYRTKYDYLIERWVVTRTAESKGASFDAIWPPSANDLHDPHPGTDDIGDERKGTHYSHYHLTVVSGGTIYDVDTTEDAWRTMPQESRVVLSLNLFGQAMNVKKG